MHIVYLTLIIRQNQLNKMNFAKFKILGNEEWNKWYKMYILQVGLEQDRKRDLHNWSA